MRLLLFLLVINQSVFSQNTASVGVSITLPSIALVDIEPNNAPINLSLNNQTEAGNPATIQSGMTDNSKWLNFTSAVPTGTSRRVSVQLSGALTNGVNLKLVMSNYTGKGAGKLGNPTITPIYLSTSPQTIVNNIGGAYTGNGQNNGYNLTYSVQIGNYSLLRTQTNTVSIIYTLMDN